MELLYDDDSPESKVLVEFRAGRMVMEGKSVKPDTRKGLIRIIRSNEPLIHFQWLNRLDNKIEIDQIIFPEEAVFEKVNQSVGRVLILKFRNDDRKFFFWMQEPDAFKDNEKIDSINFHLNDTSWMDEEMEVRDEYEEEGEGGEEEEDEEEEKEKEEDDKNGIDKNNTEHRPTNNSISTLPSVTSTSMPAQHYPLIPNTQSQSQSQAQPIINPDFLKQILSNISQTNASQAEKSLKLNEIFKAEYMELILPIFENEENIQRLIPHLPDGLQNKNEIIELLFSPQFQQQLAFLTQVLQNGQIDFSQFGIDPTRYGLGVEGFLQAIQDQVNQDKVNRSQNN